MGRSAGVKVEGELSEEEVSVVCAVLFSLDKVATRIKQLINNKILVNFLMLGIFFVSRLRIGIKILKI